MDNNATNSNSQTSLWGLLRPFSTQMGIIVGILILLALTDLGPPFAIKLLIDDVFANSEFAQQFNGQWKLLALILVTLLGSYILRNTLFYISRMIALKTSEDVCFSLRKQLFDHLQQLSLRFYRSNQPGQVGARVMDDTYKIQTFIQDKLPLLLLNTLKFQILIVVISVINIKLALASIIILPLQFVTYRFFRTLIRTSHSEAQENMSLAYGSIVEKFLGIEVVKGFAAEARESEIFNQAIDESRKSQIKSQRYHFAQKVAADLLVGLGTIMLIAYGAFEVINGHMKGGEFMMFFGYVMMLYPSVLEIISGVGHSSKATASAIRVFDMLDEPITDKQVKVNTAEETKLIGDIKFSNVSFAYDESSEVLKDVTFTIRAGERIAITGPSGSGKSTTTSLLPRFNIPTSGKITIDGKDIGELPLPTLRGAIGIAFQEVFLFDATIYENLRYARANATREEVLHACVLTGADRVVSGLPQGFETKLSEFGVELSRGEKQRITLARALLKDSPILILDEATASIDRESSHEIMEKIALQMTGHTIIMVTHEPNLLRLVDRVVCIRDGRVTYEGKPEEYMLKEFGMSTSQMVPQKQIRNDEHAQPTHNSDPDDRDDPKHHTDLDVKPPEDPFVDIISDTKQSEHLDGNDGVWTKKDQ